MVLAKDCYILDGRQPVPVDWETYWRWSTPADEAEVYEDGSRTWEPFTLAATRLPAGWTVLTVFAGDNAELDATGRPLVFETFSREQPDLRYDLRWRYATWEAAERGHEAYVAAAVGGRFPAPPPEP